MTKKVYCYIEVPDELEGIKEAWGYWLAQTIHRVKVGLDPNIELYQMEEAENIG